MARLTRRRLGALAAGSTVAGALGTACRADPAPAGDAFKQFRYVVVLMFENRSFDNILGWLYERDSPPRGQSLDGVAGKDLSNPIPPGADQAGRGRVAVGKGAVMDMPFPDPVRRTPTSIRSSSARSSRRQIATSRPSRCLRPTTCRRRSPPRPR
jgi:hypothetical protein